MRKFKIGDKVQYRRHGKIRVCTVTAPPEDYAWSAPNEVWGRWHDAGTKENKNKRPTFVDEKEVSLIKQGGNMLKKVRLTKSMLLYKKGAVFQETSDGDDYMLITPEHAKYPCYKVETKLIPKEAVKKNPKVFEEVFSAEDIYFTKAELEKIKKLK